MPSTSSTGNGEHLRALDRVFDTLEAFTTEQPEWGISALSRHLGVDKATLHRLLRNLERRGYVAQDPESRRYRLAAASITLARTALAATPERIAAPHLAALAERCGEQVTLWVLDGDHAICIAKVSGRHGLRTHTELGTRAPALDLASGRCLLAHRDVPLATILGRRDAATQVAALERVREDGVAVARGTRWPGVNAVAAPVRDHTGTVVAAVGASAPDQRFGDIEVAALTDAVTSTARAVSAALGAVG